MAEKIYVTRCFWDYSTRATKADVRQLRLLYSDKTWEVLEFYIPYRETFMYIRRRPYSYWGKELRKTQVSFKSYMQVYNISHNKMTKRKAHNYLKKKVEEWRAYCDQHLSWCT